jgi:hypothetical protein
MPAMTKSHICRIWRAQTHQQITLVVIVTTKAGIFMCLAAETAMPPADIGANKTIVKGT